MHGAGGSAPQGNRNPLKHGAHAAEALVLKREITALAAKLETTALYTLVVVRALSYTTPTDTILQPFLGLVQPGITLA